MNQSAFPFEDCLYEPLLGAEGLVERRLCRTRLRDHCIHANGIDPVAAEKPRGRTHEALAW